MTFKLFSNHRCARALIAVISAIALAPGNSFAGVNTDLQSPTQVSQPTADTRIPPDQLDSLVAPIALYPDPMLAQTLAASTYPIELMELQQWMAKNPGLKDQALRDAISKQPWDPSIQAMAGLPDVVKRLTDDIEWTTDLGNAFLAQQSDVMNAVQRMRQKAQQTGNLKSTPQQSVETQVVDNTQSVIVIQQADPQVVYVPSYNPVDVYGAAPYYPYPSIYYPPVGAYAAGMALSFGAGVAMGAFWGGGWGWGAGWGHGDLTINNNNNFNRNANVNRAGNVNRTAGNAWQHNPQHRGGTPYGDRATANRFGGTARGDSLANRQVGARQQLNSQGGNLRSGATGTAGRSIGSSAGTLGDRAGAGNLGDRAGAGNLGDRAGAGGFGDRAGAGDLGDRAGAGSFGDRSGGFGGGSDRIGSHDLSRGGEGGGAFGGGFGGFNGGSARENFDRGSSSMRGGGFGGGGFGGHSFGGGGFGGGGFGGGGFRGGGRR